MRRSICKLAERLASRNSESSSKFHLVAVIAQGSRVITYAFNSNKTPGQYPASIHAEDAACRRVQFHIEDLHGADLYITRILANGTMGMSKPCPACQKILRDSEIDTVHYTTSEGRWTSMEIIHG